MTSPDLETPRPAPRRLARLAAAVALSCVAVLYGGAWAWQSLRDFDILSDRLGLAQDALASRRVELGFDIEYDERLRAVTVQAVRPGTPAAAAGVVARDRIVAVDGRSVRDSAAPLGAVYLERQPGDAVELAIVRGEAPEPVVHRAVFRERTPPSSVPALLRIALQTTVLFPFVMLAVALPVLFYRLDDAHAWRLALLFSCLVAAPAFPNGFAGLDGPLRAFAMGYRSLLGGLIGAVFYWFFAVFPARSAFDRRLPRLKWLLLGAGLVFGLAGLSEGAARPPELVRAWLGAGISRGVWLAYGYGAIVLAFAGLVGSARRPPTPDARRRIQVIAWGTLVGVAPAVLFGFVADLGGLLPDWAGPVAFLALFLFPLSFAYAVVRHRVLELPLLLRRSARYLLVRRGFVVLLALLALAANALFAFSFTRLFPVDPTLATSVGVGFGLALASLAAPGVRGATRRIDRAFFRGAYDARVILEQLSERIRTVASPAELAAVLEQQLTAALQPGTAAVYLRSPQGLRAARDGLSPAELAPSPALDELARAARPREASGRAGGPLVPSLAPLVPECLVPIAARGELLGLVVLGQRLSEEPYSGEDLRLLATVAAQSAVALENVNLAARIAERLDAERRAEREMELARQVQSRLLPRAGRRLPTLDCAGRCMQARAVGGDYFDFLEAPGGRLGLVLGDVSGKGFAAALLMASLQASLRTLAARCEPLAERLAEVNRLLLEASEPSRYATLFVGEYDDASRRLQYVNCGHNPPLLVRGSGAVERLQPTAMVVGLVEEWACALEEAVLEPGDLLVVYSDGISEALDAREQEFGDARLAEAVAACRERSVPEILDAAFAAVRAFSAGEQADDQTLVVARATPR